MDVPKPAAGSGAGAGYASDAGSAASAFEILRIKERVGGGGCHYWLDGSRFHSTCFAPRGPQLPAFSLAILPPTHGTEIIFKY